MKAKGNAAQYPKGSGVGSELSIKGRKTMAGQKPTPQGPVSKGIPKFPKKMMPAPKGTSTRIMKGAKIGGCHGGKMGGDCK
jgi:hypothetical protein